MKPYTGGGDYIFVSYSHKDADRVYPIIEYFLNEGYNIWYDEGIDPGTEWDENIAAHLNGCVGILAFLSENYLNSENCKDELNYARDLGKGRVLVYLEPVELPAGMAMRLNRIQALHRYKYDKMDDFFAELTKAPLFKENDVSSKEYKQAAAPIEDKPEAEVKPETNAKPVVEVKAEAGTKKGAETKPASDVKAGITKKDFLKKEEYRIAGNCIFGSAIAIYVFAVVMMFVGGLIGGMILIAFTVLAQLRLNQWFAVVGAVVAIIFSFILPFFIIVLLAVIFFMLCLLETDRLYRHYLTDGEILPFTPGKGLFVKK